MPALNELLEQTDYLKKKMDEYREWDQKAVQEALNIEYTYDSNRIEGNTLTRLAYYAALEKCNLENTKEDFHSLIAMVVIQSQQRLLKLVEEK